MSKIWELNDLRRLAGLTMLVESPHNDYDDEDDADDDEDVARLAKDRAQTEFERKNKKVIDAKVRVKGEDDDAAPSRVFTPKDKLSIAGQAAAAASSGKNLPAEEKAAKAAKPAADTPPKKKGKALDPKSKQQRAIDYIRKNPEVTRKEFLVWAWENLEMTTGYSSSRLGGWRVIASSGGDVKECWTIAHPTMSGYTLAEDFNGKGYRWVGSTDEIDSIVLTTQDQVNEMVQYMAEWKNLTVTPIHITGM